MDAEVVSLLSTTWIEHYSRVFLSTIRIPVKDEEDNDDTGYSWADNIDMKDIREATRGRNIREDLEVAVREHVCTKPYLSRIPDYQYFNYIYNM